MSFNVVQDSINKITMVIKEGELSIEELVYLKGFFLGAHKATIARIVAIEKDKGDNHVSITKEKWFAHSP